MARTASNNIDIKVTAQDRASKQFKAIQTSAARMPEQFAKSATALRAFESASIQAGGQIADMTNKLSGLGALVATGGPVGIAIAGMSSAVLLGGVAFESLTAEMRSAKNAAASLSGVIITMNSYLDKQRQTTQDLQKKVKDFGKKENEIQADGLKTQIEGRKAAVSETLKLIEAHEKRATALREEASQMYKTRFVHGELVKTEDAGRKTKLEQAEIELKYAETLRTGLNLGKEATEENIKQIASLDELGQKEKEKEANIKRTAKALSELLKRENERLRLAAKYKQDSLNKLKEDHFNEIRAYREKHERLADLALKSAKFLDKQDEKEKARSEKAASRALQSAAIASDAVERLRDDYDATGQELDKQQYKMIEYAGRAEQFTNILSEQFSAVALGEQSVGKAAAKTGLTVARSAITTAAASAAAKQLDAHAFLPFIGLAVGGAAAATIFGIIMAYMDKLPKAASGGLIGGGVPGRDSVGVLTQHGEGILMPGQTKIIQRLADTLDRLDKRGGKGIGGPTMVVNNNSVVPPTSAETARSMKHVSKQLNRLKARGF